MSMKWMVWAFEQTVGSPTAKFVLVKLADNTNERSNVCWPSIKLMAEQTELSERSVQRALKELEDGGFIATGKQFAEDGRQSSNSYRLCPGEGDRMTRGLSPGGRHGGGDSDAVSPGAGVSVSPKPSNTRTQKNLVLEPPASGDAAPSKPLKTPRKMIGDYQPDAEAKVRACAYWRERGRLDLVSSVDDEIARFVAHHKATGSRMADWDAAWQTWYSNAIQFTKPAAGAASVAFEDTNKRGWISRLRTFHGQSGSPKGSWVPKWGPPPGAKGCKVPSEAERAFNRGEAE